MISKLHDISSLRNILNKHKAEGKVIVFTNGCFDVFHIGHIRYLRDASYKGDILVVAVNSDASVRYNKGPGRPVFNQKERVELLSALEFVDYITIFENNDVSELLLTLKPHFHAKGTDYTPETVPEKDIVRSYGGRVIITGDKKQRSSRDLISFINPLKCKK